jgi:hypothetical protein
MEMQSDLQVDIRRAAAVALGRAIAEGNNTPVASTADAQYRPVSESMAPAAASVRPWGLGGGGESPRSMYTPGGAATLDANGHGARPVGQTHFPSRQSEPAPDRRHSD